MDEGQDSRAALADIWRSAGCDASALQNISLTGSDPVLPSNFKVGTAASSAIAAASLAAAELWRLRGGDNQSVSVDIRAATAAFRGERYLRIDGEPPSNLWDPLAGYYQTRNGGWIQLHTNFPHHRDGVLEVLGCANDRAAVQAGIREWDEQPLEDALAERGMCAGLVRSREQWQAHPQALAIADLPLFEITKIGDSAPEPLSEAARPLGEVRVLDLTRVIAGPVCGRTLAEHGAQVMRIGARHLPSVSQLVIDTGRGKRSAWLDLRDERERERLRLLVGQSDVFVQGYRPGAIASHGFSPEELAALRPGIVYVTLCAYSHAGPWRSRRGFDSLVQTVSGFAHQGGVDFGVQGPKPLPCQALDYATGYLAAFGAMVALARRATQGGSWMVRVSLAQTGRWIDGLGRVAGTEHPDMVLEEIEELMQTSRTSFGELTYVNSPVRLSQTPTNWDLPVVPLGTHAPEWPG